MEPKRDTRPGDAVVALETICKAGPNDDIDLSDCIAVSQPHPYLQRDGPAVRPLRNTADRFRRYYDSHRLTDKRYKTIVIVAPTDSQLSPELDRDLVKMHFPLPEEPELQRELNKLIVGRDPLPFASGLSDTARQSLCDKIAGAGRGLTLEDYRRGLQLFRVSGIPVSDTLIEQMHLLKARVIKSQQALEYSRHDNFMLGGLEKVKEWIKRREEPAVRDSVRKNYHLPVPKGVMLCGVSGGGKSQLAKFIAKEFNLALLRLDVGALFGSIRGRQRGEHPQCPAVGGGAGSGRPLDRRSG